MFLNVVEFNSDQMLNIIAFRYKREIFVSCEILICHVLNLLFIFITILVIMTNKDF